jgi:hypothetical protein
MKSFRDYLQETEQQASHPVVGDAFDIELAPDELAEGYVIESTEDRITIVLSESAVEILEQQGALKERIARYGPVGSTRSQGYTMAEEQQPVNIDKEESGQDMFDRVLELAGCGRRMEEEVDTTDPLADKAAALAPVGAQGSQDTVDTIDEGVMKSIAAELGEIADTEDYDRLYDLMTSTSPAGQMVQKIADEISINNRLYDDDHEELLELVMDRLIDDFGGADLNEAEYQGRNVDLNKPMQGDVKKFKVYVKDPKTGNIKKVNFGDKTMRIKKSNPARRRSFRARHNCDNPGPKTKARYWSCRKW